MIQFNRPLPGKLVWEGRLAPFRFWCQKVIPLIYDNSLSYYEVLCKLVVYLNAMIQLLEETIALVNELRDYIASLVDMILEELEKMKKDLQDQMDAEFERFRLEILALFEKYDQQFNDYLAGLDQKIYDIVVQQVQDVIIPMLEDLIDQQIKKIPRWGKNVWDLPGYAPGTDMTAVLTAAQNTGLYSGFIFPKADYHFTSEMTFTVPVYFFPGSKVVTYGYKVHFTQMVVAEKYAIFTNADVSLEAGQEVRASWFGAIPGYDQNVMTYIQHAISCIQNANSILFLDDKMYVNDIVRISNPLGAKITGRGFGGVMSLNSSEPGFFIEPTAGDVSFSDMVIDRQPWSGLASLDHLPLTTSPFLNVTAIAHRGKRLTVENVKVTGNIIGIAYETMSAIKITNFDFDASNLNHYAVCGIQSNRHAGLPDANDSSVMIDNYRMLAPYGGTSEPSRAFREISPVPTAGQSLKLVKNSVFSNWTLKNSYDYAIEFHWYGVRPFGFNITNISIERITTRAMNILCPEAAFVHLDINNVSFGISTTGQPEQIYGIHLDRCYRVNLSNITSHVEDTGSIADTTGIHYPVYIKYSSHVTLSNCNFGYSRNAPNANSWLGRAYPVLRLEYAEYCNLQNINTAEVHETASDYIGIMNSIIRSSMNTSVMTRGLGLYAPAVNSSPTGAMTPLVWHASYN